MNRDHETSEVDENAGRYTVFSANGQYFAVEITSVREVLESPRRTRLPNAKPFMSGVFNLRGRIYSVVDLGRLVRFGDNKATGNKMVLIIGKPDEALGIFADQVEDMITIEEKNIKKASEHIPEEFRSFTSGYYERDSGRLYIINVPGLIKQVAE
jgi:chemotaxis signal transduction protein